MSRAKTCDHGITPKKDCRDCMLAYQKAYRGRAKTTCIDGHPYLDPNRWPRRRCFICKPLGVSKSSVNRRAKARRIMFKALHREVNK